MKEEIQNCQNCKNNFVIESEDFDFYEKIKVPPPTFCPECRMQRRFAFRNERKLFRVKDAFTGKDIFSLYPPESNRKVVTQEEWHGDSWDGMEYGVDYDFSRNFFEQFIELEKQVPIYNLNVKMMVNSPYSGNASALKNCYLVFNSNNSVDCMYGNAINDCTDCVDNSHITNCERCYDSFWLLNCYQCYFSIMCVESRNLWFSRDCLDCSDCFGCTNLRKSSYCIFNKQYTKEEYNKIITEMNLGSYGGVEKGKKLSRDFWQTQINKYNQGIKNLNSTGAYVSHSKNAKNCYLTIEGENLAYCQYMLVKSGKDCMDASIWGQSTELCYETSVCGDNVYNMKFCFNCWPNCKDVEYSMNLSNCSDCFGCVCLKNKKYCIFNKQYSKDDYKKITEEIREQMKKMPYVDKQGNTYFYGEFFPIELSPFGYNNTIAMQHFPLTKEKAESIGYEWVESTQSEYKITNVASDLPDSIHDVTEEILNKIIECEGCKKAYKITASEFSFLKKENIPLPHLCNDCRHEIRLKDRLNVFLYDRSCMCAGETDEGGKYTNTVKHAHANLHCGETFKTGYAPDRSEIVYCEKCYQQEVY